jgi:hypothetical protein
MHILRFQKHREVEFSGRIHNSAFGWCHTFREHQILPFCIDLVYRFLLVLGGLTGPTPILGVLPTTGDVRTGLIHQFPTRLSLEFAQMSMARLVHQKFATLETNTPQNFHQEFEELRVIHRACQNVMAKVTGALVIVFTTSTAHFPIL